ncbi:MAG TPA: phospho-sugar mutase, partial [Microbacteriaceae bacterium]|nr:phospho-sugar mutase [Microbacteriaceae bacterium]
MSISPNELAKALSAAEHWAVHDPDPQTKNEAIGLINLVTLGEPSAEEAIVAQFGERLAFGTAGLRGEIGAGPSRMNKMVVMQTSAALAKWLWNRSELGSASNPPSIVVGFDARTKSDVFARAAAEVFMGAGLRTILLPGPLPTPLTAFAVKHLDVSAGVMITASHNPPKDNGYKVFLGDSDCGSQIAAPADQEISEIIELIAANPVSEIPLETGYEFASNEIFDAYIDAFRNEWQAPKVESDLTVVYTALHGVGSTVTQRLFAELGLPKLHTVDSQDTPDGSFPTVSFPNPEEPGALDEAYSKAREVGADLIIAHDPDADRLAVALPDSE